MPLEGLENGALDLVLFLAEELLRRGLQEVGVLHDLDLRHARDGERNTLGCLHALADGVQGHDLREEGRGSLLVSVRLVPLVGSQVSEVTQVHGSPRGRASARR